MSAVSRGAKNAFRNTIRTFSVTIILAISIGLALVMVLSYKTVQARIETVQATVGNNLTVSAAGSQGFEGGGEPLTNAILAPVSSIAHVTKVTKVLQGRLDPSTDTSLVSAIDPGTLGNRQGRAPRQISGDTSGSATRTPRTITIPVMVTGISDTSSLLTGEAKLTAGVAIDPSGTADTADVGSALATKNNLSVGSTFTVYGTTMTVSGIYDAGNEFANAGMFIPIQTLETLAQQPDEVTTASVTIDSVTNVDSTLVVVKDKLGTAADVVSNADAAKTTIEPLENIKTISLYSVIGALVAGSIITLLTMIMIVRERRREIGVLKAIGASNLIVVGQFVTESLVMTLMGSVVGVLFGIAFSNPILNALLTSSTSSTTTTTAGGGGFGGRAGFQAVRQFGGSAQQALTNLHATVGYNVLGYGLLAAIGIAILGSALPAWLIAKVKPAEVMRGE